MALLANSEQSYLEFAKALKDKDIETCEKLIGQLNCPSIVSVIYELSSVSLNENHYTVEDLKLFWRLYSHYDMELFTSTELDAICKLIQHGYVVEIQDTEVKITNRLENRNDREAIDQLEKSFDEDIAWYEDMFQALYINRVNLEKIGVALSSPILVS